MSLWRYIPLLCIALQALINIPFYGIPAILFMTILPVLSSSGPVLSLLILAYFSLAVAHLYYVTFSPNPGRARLAGYAYFSVGLAGSLVVVSSSLGGEGFETPLLPSFMLPWAFLSLVGIVGIRKGTEGPGVFPSIVAMFLVVIAAVISASTVGW